MERSLGIKETWGMMLHKQMPLNITSVLKLNLPVTTIQLEQSYKHVLQKFSVLNTCIKNGQLIELAVPQDVNIIECGIYDEDKYRNFIDRDITDGIDITNGPMLRVAYFTQQKATTLIMTFCHIVVDAKSAGLIAADFIHYLVSGKGLAILPDKNYPIPPTLEELLDFPSNTLKTATTASTPVTQLRTESVSHYLNHDTLSTMYNLAKKDRLTFPLYLSASLLKSVYSKTNSSDDDEVILNFSMMEDVRRFFKQKWLIGNFVMPLMIPITVSRSSSIKELGLYIHTYEEKFRPKEPAQLGQKSNLNYPCVSLSSIDQMDNLYDEKLDLIEKIFWYNNIHGFINTPNSIALSYFIFKGKCLFQLAYPAPLVNKEYATSIYQKLLAAIK